MESSKVEQLKSLINKSPLFEIDKETSSAQYKTELELLATRLFQLYGKSAQEYGAELYDALLDSVKYYDKTKGDFLVLFDISFKQKINKNKKRPNVFTFGLLQSLLQMRLLYATFDKGLYYESNYLKPQRTVQIE